MLISVVASTPSWAGDALSRSTDRSARVPLAPAQAAAFKRAMSHFKDGEYAQSIPDFDETIRLQPDFAVALAERGFARIETGDFSGAIADHDAVLRLATDSPNAFANSCWARAVAATDLDFALTLCIRSGEMHPSLDAFDAKGFVHFRRGEFIEAIKAYDASIRLRPSGSSYFMRGVCKSRLGQAEAGLADIRKGEKKDPEVRARYQRFGVNLPA